MNRPLTVVLPLHNAERYLQNTVLDLLELAHELPHSMQIVLLDDASTDETYEMGCEMARMYPQLQVFRQPVRRGLDAALAMISHHLETDAIVVHDGRLPILASDLKSLLEAEPQGVNTTSQSKMAREKRMDSMASRRFGSFQSLQENMEKAHKRVLGFSWRTLEKPLIPRRVTKPTPRRETSDMPSLSADKKNPV